MRSLVKSSHETLAALHGKRHISVLGMVDVERFNRKQAWIVVSIFAGAIVAGATGLSAAAGGDAAGRCCCASSPAASPPKKPTSAWTGVC